MDNTAHSRIEKTEKKSCKLRFCLFIIITYDCYYLPNRGTNIEIEVECEQGTLYNSIVESALGHAVQMAD